MMRAWLAGLALVVVTALVAVAPAGPAQAGVCHRVLGVLWCGMIQHYTPDGGLDSPIRIRCDYGDPKTGHYLREGQSSTRYCKDTDQVYNYAGQKIRCLHGAVSLTPHWEDEFKTTGWHKINGFFNMACVVARR